MAQSEISGLRINCSRVRIFLRFFFLFCQFFAILITIPSANRHSSINIPPRSFLTANNSPNSPRCSSGCVDASLLEEIGRNLSELLVYPFYWIKSINVQNRKSKNIKLNALSTRWMNPFVRNFLFIWNWENLGSIDDSVQWLHNFERLQQLQTQVIWPSIAELEPRSFVPDASFKKIKL